MVRSLSRRRSYSNSTGVSDLYSLLALIALPIVVLLFWILQNSNPNWFGQITRGVVNTVSPPTALPLNSRTPSQTQVLTITHRALCEPGRNRLNIRPSAGFSDPIALIPCGGGVAVTGSPVWREGEYWSPVVYGNVQGWSVSRLLQRI